MYRDESSVPSAMESLQPSLAAGVEQCLWETGIDSYTERWADNLGLGYSSAGKVCSLFCSGFDVKGVRVQTGPGGTGRLWREESG